MTNFADDLEVKMLGHTLLGSIYTAPVANYLTLCTSVNSDAIAFTEVASGLGYDRQLMTWGAPTSGPDWTVLNQAAVNFAQANTPWGTVNHYVITDSATIGTGNALYWVDLLTPRPVASGDVLQIGIGQLTVRLD